MEGGHEAIATTVDERVVEMRFDNRQFEDGIQTSLSSLDKLRQSLNLEGAAKGLESIDDAAQKCKISPLGDAVDTVKLKFSALEVVAITTLANITNSVVNTGKRMIKSLTVDPISDGFSEYELKMDSVQTIMNSSGESLETVTGYLDELNTYADKTIYSFSDMTNNIGKFTNAGVNLKDSVAAIQGVSNVAAVSGANTQQASHAMYNFAQALSSGAVKLIDWKSIETANMATVEFKNELLKTAVELGTVKKQGDKYISTTKDLRGKVSAAFDANTGFNESLSNQWMTSEVLVKTLGRYSDETTEIGKKAFAAAQDVKTFSQLMDTLKEGVGSGWATTWELIFGNFEEAKQLWTEAYQFFGGFLDSMSNSRNAVLEDWNKLGGRAALLDSVRNTLKGIVSFIKPIKQGFKEIFPAVTGKQLADITKQLRDFTAKFKIGGKAAKDWKNTFKGVFAIFDIGGQALSALLGGAKKLLPFLPKLGGGLLTVTGGLGEFLTKADEFVRKHQVFQKAVTFLPKTLDMLFKKITGMSAGEALKIVVEKFSDGVDLFKEALSRFKSIDTSGFESVTDKVSARLQPFSVLLDGLGKLFRGTLRLAAQFAPVFGALMTAFGKILGNLGEGLSTLVSETDFDTVIDMLNGGLMVSIGVGLRKFVDNLSGITGNLSDISENAGGIVEGIKEIFGGVTDCLGAMQQRLKADILQKIALSVGILTASLLVLSTIDSEKLSGALAALVGEFITLFGAMAIFEKTSGSQGIGGMSKAVGAMTAFATAILILSFAMRNLSAIDSDKLASSTLAVGTLLVMLVGSAKYLSKNVTSVTKGASSLVILALALRMLVNPVERLAALNPEGLTRGLVGVMGLVLSLGLFLKGADLDKSGIAKGAGLLLIAKAIDILAGAVERFGALDEASLAKGMISVGSILAGFAAFTQYIGTPDKIISLGVGLTIVAASMLIFAKAIQQMGSMSEDEIGKGLVTMAAGLLAVTLALKLIPPTAPLTALGLVLVGAALNLLALALERMGKMSMAEIGKSLLLLAGSLTIIAVAVTLMIAALPGAAALVVVAGALAVLTPVLKILGGMPLGSIVKALLALAGVFAIIGAAPFALTPLLPAIVALAGALLLLGVGMTGIGVGLFAIGAGLTSLAVSLTTSVASIIASLRLLIVGIISLIPDTVKAVVSIIPALTDALIIIVKSLCDVLIQCTPPLVKAIMVVLVTVLKALADYTPQIVEYLFVFLIGLIDGLAKYLPQLIVSAVNLLGALFGGIIDALGGMDSGALLKMVAGMGIIAGAMYLFSAVAAVIPAAMAGVIGVGAVIAELGLILAAIGLLTKIPGLSKAIDNGGLFLEAIGVAIGRFFGGILGGVAKGISGQLPVIAKDISLFMVNLTPFFLAANAIDKSSMEGVNALAGAILTLTAANVINGLTSWFTGGVSLRKFGEEIADFAPYLRKFADSVEGIDSASVESSANAAKALAEFAKAIPNTGGLAAKFAGENSLSAFADELVAFGPKIKTYADSVKGLTPDAVEASANAALSLAEMAKNLPNQGGMASWFTGDNQLSVFGKELAAFGPEFRKYAESVSDISPDAVTASATAAKALGEMATNLPNQGGMTSWFGGDNDFGTFGKNLEAFGKSFASYANSVKDVKPDVVTATASAAESLSELCKHLPQKKELFSGEMSLPDLGKAAEGFGKHLGKFYASISGVNVSVLSGVVKEAKNVLNILKGAQKLDGSATANFGKSLKSIGSAGLDRFIAAFKDGTGKIQNAAKEMMDSFAESVKIKKAAVANAFVAVIAHCISKIKEKYSDFREAGRYLVKGFAAGITAERPSAITAAAKMAGASLEAAQRKLQIHSPSKAFYAVGRFAGQGFVGALGDFRSQSYRAGSNMANDALDGLSQAIQRIGELVDSDIDVQPTIRPVLDLSDVQNGAKKLGKLLPSSEVYSAASYRMASRIARGLAEGRMSNERGANGGVTMYNTFTEANARDGMALLNMLNRELGGVLW